MPTVLTSETHTIYTLDSDLSYSKLLALWNLSNLSYSASFLENNQSSTGLTVGTLVTLVGEHLDVLIMFLVMVCCSGIKLYMKCVALVYTGSIIHSTKPNSLGRLALFVVATVYLTWLCF